MSGALAIGDDEITVPTGDPEVSVSHRRLCLMDEGEPTTAESMVVSQPDRTECSHSALGPAKADNAAATSALIVNPRTSVSAINSSATGCSTLPAAFPVAARCR